MTRIRRKLLFVAEAVTLAQVVRLAALARSLPEEQYEVHFAAARFDELIFAGMAAQRWPIDSISPAQAERAVAWGLRLYDLRTLRRYLDDDLRLIDAVKPDLIVGDLRWSLAVSGPKSGVKVLSLANAWWSPFAERAGFPLPEHPIVRLLGVELAGRHFPKALPAVFRHFARPLNDLRERHGLAPLGSLPEVLTWGDRTLYADPPGFFRMRALPASHRFLGPVHWAPDLPFELPGSSRPLVYVTLGSSGNLESLPVVLEALGTLPVDVLLATAGRRAPKSLPPNVRAEAFVRGDLAARRAAVVVCNGGGSTAYQALAEGTPVVGLPYNLDQYLALGAIVEAGAGVLIRSGVATPQEVRAAVERALHDPALEAGARRAAAALGALDAPSEFARIVKSS